MHKRIYSLLSVGTILSGTLYVVACGGSSSKPDSGVVVHDSAGQPDAFTCALNATDLAALGSGVGLGSAQIPLAADGSGGSGQNELEVTLVVTGFSDPTVGIFFGLINSGSGVFSTAEAGKFSGPPRTGTYAMDDDANWGAGFDIINGITDNGNGTVTIAATQAYLLDTSVGTPQFQITSWTGALTANGKSNVGFQWTNATMDGGTVDSSGSFTQDSCMAALVLGLQVQSAQITWPATIPPGSARLPGEKPNPHPWNLSHMENVQAINIHDLIQQHE